MQKSITRKLLMIKESSCLFLLSLLLIMPSPGAASDETQLLEQLQAQDSREAEKAAGGLGLIRSVEGLRAIIEIKNRKFVSSYIHRFSSRFPLKQEDLDPQIEELIVQHFSEPTLGLALRQLISPWMRYRSKELFTLLLEEVLNQGQKGRVDWELTQDLTSTKLKGIDDDLLEAVPKLPYKARADILTFLVGRNYEKTSPYIEETLLNLQINSNRAGLLGRALAQAGTEETAEILVRYIAWVSKKPPTQKSINHMRNLIHNLGDMPKGAPLDFARLKQALPDPLDDKVVPKWIDLIKNRQERAGVPDLLGYLASDKHQKEAMDALFDFEDKEVWRQARDKVERLYKEGVMTEGRYGYATHSLGERLNKTEAFLETKRKQELNLALREEKRKLYSGQKIIFESREADPEKFVQEFEKNLVELENLANKYTEAPHIVGLISDLVRSYASLGDFSRFSMAQLDQAIRYYQKAIRLSEKDGAIPGFFYFRIADTYRNELRNTKAALRHYQIALDIFSKNRPRPTDDGIESIKWLENFLKNEINYLETGRSFAGSIGKEEVAGASWILMMQAGVNEFGVSRFDTGLSPNFDLTGREAVGDINRNTVLIKMKNLPRSHLVFTATMPAVSYLPTPESVLEYLQYQDPGGYWSASLLAMAVAEELYADPSQSKSSRSFFFPGSVGNTLGKPNVLRSAADRFQKKTGVRFDLEPDQRFSSPEQTWEHFISSLKKGDAEGVLSCFIPKMAAKLEPLFSQMSAHDMKKMAENTTAFALKNDMGNIKEYFIRRNINGNNIGGFAYFTLLFGEWKIQSM